MPYTFQAVKDMDQLVGSSKICNLIESFTDCENQFSILCGKIKALFGQPVYQTENMEDLFPTVFWPPRRKGTKLT